MSPSATIISWQPLAIVRGCFPTRLCMKRGPPFRAPKPARPFSMGLGRQSTRGQKPPVLLLSWPCCVLKSLFRLEPVFTMAAPSSVLTRRQFPRSAILYCNKPRSCCPKRPRTRVALTPMKPSLSVLFGYSTRTALDARIATPTWAYQFPIRMIQVQLHKRRHPRLS